MAEEKPTLFQDQVSKPLAEMLRPKRLEDVAGQGHLLGPEGKLSRMVAAAQEGAALPSLIFWGPPGTGKTTIARLLAARVGLAFEPVSAVFDGVADLRKVFARAEERRRLGEGTLLFVDEVHRFNKVQQDGLLPHVEDGRVILVGATTENPSFALNGALLSRAQVMVLNRLDDAALEELILRAEAILDRNIAVDEEARAMLKAMADGDGRYLLNMVETILAQQPEAEAEPLTPDMLKNVLSMRAAEKMIGKATFEISEKLEGQRNFSRSLYVAEDIKKGQIIDMINVRSVRPGFGLHPKHYEEILGKRVNKDLKKGTPMSFEHID